MADRAFDRIFNEAAAREAAAEEAFFAAQPKQRTAADEEAELRAAAAPMTAADAIARIQLAWKDKDYFRLLQLPRPEADALGRPSWSGTPADVSRAYRRLSILVHPDKFAGQEERQAQARAAFEALNEAHRLLRDPGTFEQALAREADAARARRQQREAEATLEERVLLNAQQKESAKLLKKREGESFQAEMLRQQRERLEAAKRKREALASSRRGGDSGDELIAASDDEGDQRKAQKKPAADEGCDSDEEAAAAARRRQNAAKRRQGRQQPQA